VNFKVVQPGRVCCVFVHILLHIVWEDEMIVVDRLDSWE
jgi:hypothetical protein